MRLFKKGLNKAMSCTVTVALIASSIAGVYIAKAADTPLPNIVLLESILNGDRGFVIDTIINDNYSTNPHAKVNYISNEKSMMATALSQYRNENDPNYSAAYKVMVDTLNVWYNKGDYAADIADAVTEWAADIVEFFGGSDSAVSKIRGCANSAKNMKFDSILQEVIKADYTASDGRTLSGSDSQLVMLRKIADGSTALKNLASAAKNISGLDYETAESTSDYVNSVLIPAADSYDKAMTSMAKATGANFEDREQGLLDLTKALGMIMVYDSVIISPENSGGVVTIAPNYLFDDVTKDIIDINSNLTKFASNTIDSYMYIRSIQTQKKSVAGVMTRTASHLASSDTRSLLNGYADLIEKAADKKTTNYDYIITALKKSGTLEKYVEKKTSKAMERVAERIVPCYEESILPSAFASVTGVIGTATTLADGVAGLEGTCTKTLELQNLEQLITYFKATYTQDLNAYKSNPTDENAAKVLDDLEFIQRMRLRGETIAYKMSKDQLDKPLGKLLAGDSYELLGTHYDDWYQRHIDSIIGASVTPFTTDGFSVKDGETLTIMNDNGLTYANYTTSKGTYSFAETEYRFANGINVSNNAKLNVFAGSGAIIPYVVNNGGTVLIGKNMNFTEYTQNGGTTTFVPSTFNIDEMYLSGGMVTSASAATINANRLTTTGETTSENISVNVLRNADLGGTFNGTVNAYANITGSSGHIGTLNICGNGQQNILGTVSVVNLTHTNTGRMDQKGTIYVSGAVKNASSTVYGGCNTILQSTGTISGDYYNSGLTLNEITLNSAKTFGDTLCTQGSVTIPGVTVYGALNQSNGTLTLNGNATVKGDSYFGGTVKQNSGTYYTSGDLQVTGEHTLNNIVANGKTTQRFIGKINTQNLTNNNTKELKISDTFNVSGILANNSGKISGLGMTLGENGTLKNSTYNGDITISSKVCEIPNSITGNAVITTTLPVNRDTVINGTLNLKGKLTLTNSNFEVKNKFTSSGTISANANSSLTFRNGIYNSGTISGSNTPLRIYGFTENSGTISNCDTSLYKDLSLTGRISGGIFTTSSEISNNGTIDVNELNLSTGTFFTINGKDLSTVNLNLSGGGKIKLKPKINVSGRYFNSNNTYIDEDNIVVASGRTISENKIYDTYETTADLTLDGCTVVIDTLTTNSKIHLTNGARLIVNKKLTMSGNSKKLEIDSGSSMNIKRVASISSPITVNGELIFESDTNITSSVSGSGSVTVKGDLVNSGDISIEEMNFYSNALITVSGKDISTVNLNLNGKGEIKFKNKINISGDYNNSSTGVNIESIIIPAGHTVTEDKTYKTWELTTDLIIDGCTLTVDTLTTNSGIRLTNGAKLIVNNKLSMTSSSKRFEIDIGSTAELKKLSSIFSPVTLNGELIFGIDTTLTSSVSGDGTIILNSDFNNSGNINIANLILNNKSLLTVSGKDISAVNLTLNGGKVKLNNKINVSGTYTNNNTDVNDENIIREEGLYVSEDRTYDNWSPVTNLTLDGCTVMVDTLSTSAGIHLTNGAELIVNKSLTMSGSSKKFEVDVGSTAELKHISSITSPIIANGEVVFGGDANLTSSISGEGSITIKGDMSGSPTINNPKNFKIISKIPQTLNVGSASFENLEIDNISKRGVTFSKAVSCYSELKTHNSKINGTITQK